MRLARAVSSVGHPAVILPASALIALSVTGRTFSPGALLGTLAVITVAMLWSVFRAYRGDWRHVDASERKERQELLLILVGLLALAVILAWRDSDVVLMAGFGASLTLVALAMLTSNRVKLSLHVAFAVLACFVIAPGGVPFVVAMAGATALIAWSRIVLQRHDYTDLAGGLAAGVIAGLVFRWLIS